jgi:hypothetical protein
MIHQWTDQYFFCCKLQLSYKVKNSYKCGLELNKCNIQMDTENIWNLDKMPVPCNHNRTSKANDVNFIIVIKLKKLP